jgi:hypothetical protein
MQAMDRTTEPPSEDKFVFWPILLAVGSLFIAVFFGSYPEYGDHAVAAQRAVIFFAPAVFLMGFFYFWAAAYAASARRWRRAASTAVFPAAIVIAILYPNLVLAPIGTAVIYIYHLAGVEMDYPY